MENTARRMSLVDVSNSSDYSRCKDEIISYSHGIDIIEEGKGCNWIHPSLSTFRTKACNLGVVATRGVAEGTILVVYGGRVLTLEEFENLPEEMKAFPYQIDGDLFMAPPSFSEIGIGERVNHSCSPNAGFWGAIHLVAIRDITAWEQITMDYATCVAANADTFKMDCLCESSRCRKVVSGQDWQLKDVQSRLLPFYQPFLKERVMQRRYRARSLR